MAIFNSYVSLPECTCLMVDPLFFIFFPVFTSFLQRNPAGISHRTVPISSKHRPVKVRICINKHTRMFGYIETSSFMMKPWYLYIYMYLYIYIVIHPVDDLVSASRDFGWHPTSVGPKTLRRPKALSHAPDRCAHSNVDLIITAIAAAVAVAATATAAFLRLCQGSSSSSSSTCANIGRNWLLVSPRKVLVTWDHPK